MTGRSTTAFGLLVAALAAGLGYVALSAHLGVAFALPVGVIGTLSAAVVLRGPVGQALAGRLGLHEGLPDQTTEQLLGELEALRARTQELEERMDFSERMLASQPRDANR